MRERYQRNRFNSRVIVIKVEVLDKGCRIVAIEVWFKLLSALHCQPLAATLLVTLAGSLARDNAPLVIQTVRKSVRWGEGRASSPSYIPSIGIDTTEAVKSLPAEQ